LIDEKWGKWGNFFTFYKWLSLKFGFVLEAKLDNLKVPLSELREPSS
jgi:hypothetical protein